MTESLPETKSQNGDLRRLVKTIVAWGPIIIILTFSGTIWVISSTTNDWLCGPPGEECHFHHPILQVFQWLSIIGVLGCLIAGGIAAIQRKLSKFDIIGFVLSALLVAGIIVLIFFAIHS